MNSSELPSICLGLLSGQACALRDEVVQLGQILVSNRKCDLIYGNPSDGESLTPEGLAISPRWAEMCLDDNVRTICFLRGVNAAIEKAAQTITDRPVRIFYAGCGPLGTLSVPLMSVYPPDQVQFTMLDIHPVSISSVRSITENLGFSNHVAEFIIGDAMDMSFDESNKPDVIVLEIMQSALDKEPQVAVARHLMGQAPQATMVPEQVSIDLALVNVRHEFELDPETGKHQRDRLNVGNVFQLDKGTILKWRNCQTNILPAARLTLPDYAGDDYQPMLLTNITCADGHCLNNHDSGLTIPKRHESLNFAVANSELQFSYVLGSNPGLTARVLSPTAARV